MSMHRQSDAIVTNTGEAFQTSEFLKRRTPMIAGCNIHLQAS